MSFNPKKQLSQFLAEDIGKGDITSQLLSKKKIVVKIISRENAIVAGTKYAKEIFAIKGCRAKIITNDGTKIKPNQDIIEITVNAEKILTCDRNALNIQNNSGIEIKINYVNTIATYTGIAIADGSERYYDITESIIIYAKAQSGTPKIVVEEIA